MRPSSHSLSPPVTCCHLTMPATPSMSLMMWTRTELFHQTAAAREHRCGEGEAGGDFHERDVEETDRLGGDRPRERLEAQRGSGDESARDRGAVAPAPSEPAEERRGDEAREEHGAFVADVGERRTE